MERSFVSRIIYFTKSCHTTLIIGMDGLEIIFCILLRFINQLEKLTITL